MRPTPVALAHPRVLAGIWDAKIWSGSRRGPLGLPFTRQPEPFLVGVVRLDTIVMSTGDTRDISAIRGQFVGRTKGNADPYERPLEMQAIASLRADGQVDMTLTFVAPWSGPTLRLIGLLEADTVSGQHRQLLSAVADADRLPGARRPREDPRGEFVMARRRP